MFNDIPLSIRRPLAKVFDLVVRIRNLAYDYDLFDSAMVSKPVMSVGNLSMGGTGKTPFVGKLIELCRERGLRPAVIARNYKAGSRGVHRVLLNYRHPQFNPASFYGDEPFMLAENFPDVPVFTGPLKYFTAQIASRDQDIDVLIIDDGFQHRCLKRDFEIVLIDSSRLDQENQMFPLGKFREDFSSLLRADLVVLTKTELAEAGQIEKLHRKIPEAIPSLEIRSRMILPQGGQKNYLAVAGIAHPQQFFSGLKNLGLTAKGYLSFPDHHHYQAADVEKIKNQMRLVGADAVLTTEKDAVKLRAFKNNEDGSGFIVDCVTVDVEFLSEPRGLNAFLDQCASH